MPKYPDIVLKKGHMEDLIRELRENHFLEFEDWLIVDGELWVSRMTCLWVVETSPQYLAILNVWEPNENDGPFAKPKPRDQTQQVLIHA